MICFFKVLELVITGSFKSYLLLKRLISNQRVHGAQAKPGKPGKSLENLENQGKPGKIKETFLKILKIRENFFLDLYSA